MGEQAPEHVSVDSVSIPIMAVAGACFTTLLMVIAFLWASIEDVNAGSIKADAEHLYQIRELEKQAASARLVAARQEEQTTAQLERMRQIVDDLLDREVRSSEERRELGSRVQRLEIQAGQ